MEFEKVIAVFNSIQLQFTSATTITISKFRQLIAVTITLSGN